MTRPRFRHVPPEQLDVEDAVAAARAIQDDPAPAALPWHGIPHTAELDEALGHARGAWAATPVGPYTYRVQDADGNDLGEEEYDPRRDRPVCSNTWVHAHRQGRRS